MSTGTLLCAQSQGGTSPGQTTFYGHLNPSILSVDDGHKTDTTLTDNGHSNSRFGILYDQDLQGGNALRLVFETGLGFPQSSQLSQNDKPGWDWEKTDLRKFEVIWSGGFGSFSAGQGSMATDGIATEDLSRTDIVSSVTVADLNGSYLFREDGGSLSGNSVSSVFDTFDGSRRFRVRYDTPSFGGLTVATSYGQEVLDSDNDSEYYDLAAFYARTYDAIEVKAGLGYAWAENDGDIGRSYAGSIAALHTPTGLNGAVSTGAEVDGGQYVYAKIGWIGDIWSAGYTAVSADWYGGDDLAGDGSSSGSWGVQLVQKVEAADLEAYLGYGVQNFDDDTSVGYQDIAAVMAGVRWSF